MAVIREVKPQVAVTYDDFGGYGHRLHPGPLGAHLCLSLAAVLSFRRPWQPWQVRRSTGRQCPRV